MRVRRRKVGSTRLCGECGKTQAIDQFRSPGTRRSKQKCRECREQIERANAMIPVWDWASAIRKALAMSVKRRPDEHLDESLNPETLRALMIAQRGTCAFDPDTPFHLPSADAIPINSTLTTWKAQLPAYQKLRVPVLVRVSTITDWAPGNVIFIQDGLAAFYSHIDAGPSGFKQTLKRMVEHVVDVPQSERLNDLKKTLRKRRLDEYHRQHRRKEGPDGV